MNAAETRNLAHELLVACENGQTVLPPSGRGFGFDLDMAYEVENELKRLREAAGHKPVGRKVGYANRAMWRALKLETLVWAHMYDDTVHHSAGTASLSLPHVRSLKVEPEIVFALKQPLVSESTDAAAALAATAWLAIGFEIIDCPYPEWKFQPSDFVASFGLHAALVIGERRQVVAQEVPFLLDQLSGLNLKVFKDGQFVDQGSGRNALRSPALCLAELANAIVRRFPDEPLDAGEIISSGTLTSGHPASPGDTWSVEAEGFPILTLRLT